MITINLPRISDAVLVIGPKKKMAVLEIDKSSRNGDEKKEIKFPYEDNFNNFFTTPECDKKNGYVHIGLSSFASAYGYYELPDGDGRINSISFSIYKSIKDPD